MTSSPALPAAENAKEIAYWNGPAGQRWMQRQEDLDALLAPVLDVLLQRAAPAPGERVIDVGCGCGDSTLALAPRVQPGGRVLGIDVAAAMLERARERAAGLPGITLALADATTEVFEPQAADLLCSRFGVMFFADPVASFANLRRGLRPGGRVAFSCWREPRANPWFMVPLQAAYRHVPKMPELGPEDPGPFSFAPPARVERLLRQAGFDAVVLEPVDLPFDLARGRGVDAAVDASMNIGPAARALEGQTPAVLEAAAASIRAALAPHQVQMRVPLPGAIWIVTALNP